MLKPNKIHDRSEITDDRHFVSKNLPDPAKILALITNIKFQLIAISIYVSSELSIVFANGGNASVSYYAWYYLIALAFFYLNILLVLPLSLKKYRSVYFPILLILLSLLFQTAAAIYITIHFYSTSKNFFDHMTPLVWIDNGWKSFQNFLIAFIVWGALTMVRILLRQKILEDNYLYSRVSPHLLFSCLNLIHSNIQAISEKGGKMIIRLSAFARSAMKEPAADGKAHLDDEIDMIRNQIEINKLRFEQDIYVQLDIGEDIQNNNLRLPPQLIFSLTDNIFKYGILDQPGLPAKIRLYKEARKLHVEIANAKVAEPDVESNKIGLSNARRRLENAYGNEYTLSIEDSDEYFKLKLSIPI